MRVAGRKDVPRRRDARRKLWVTLLFVIGLTIISNHVFAAFECNDESWQGFSGLYAIARSVTGANRTHLVANIDYRTLKPSDSLLVVHPQISLDDGSLSGFIQAGGRVAIIDDFGASDSFLDRFSIRRLSAPGNPSLRLRNNVHLPIATPVEIGTNGQPPQRHPIVKNAEQVVLNHPTAFVNPGLSAVLEIRTNEGSRVPVALTGIVGSDNPGRLFVMSDPSAFMNLMLRYPGNLNFALGLIHYLTEEDGRAGKGSLYIVANRFEQSGHFGTGLGLLADARHALDRTLRELQQGLPSNLLVLLVVITVLGIARWVYRNAFRPGSTSIPKFLRAVPVSAQAGWPGRAAILMAPSTHPAFVIMELRSSFRERLSRILSVDSSITSPALLSLIEEKRLLPSPTMDALKRYLTELDGYERAVAARRGLRIRKNTLLRLMKQGIDILDHFNHFERNRREPSPSSK
jgi:hypothetical protein